MHLLDQYRNLPRQIYSIAAVRMIAEIGIMFVFPFMSLLSTQRLGFTTVQAGYIMSVLSVCSIIGSLIGGKMADRFGRRRVYLLLCAFVIAFMLLAGLFGTNRIVIVFVVAAQAFNVAMLPAASAIIVDLSDESDRDDCFSLVYIFTNIGAAVGPVLAGMLFYEHMSLSFWAMAFFYALAFFIMLTRVRESGARTVKTEEKREGGAQEVPLLKMVLGSPTIPWFMLGFILMTMCYMELSYMLPLQLSDELGLDIGSKMSSVVWIINGAVVVLLSPLLHLWIRKHRALYNIIFGCLIYVVGFGCYALPFRMPLFLAATVIWTCGEICINTETNIFLAEQAPDTHTGRMISLNEFGRAAGKALGPLLTGYALNVLSYQTIWLAAACLCLVVAGVFALLYRKNMN